MMMANTTPMADVDRFGGTPSERPSSGMISMVASSTMRKWKLAKAALRCLMLKA